ncbi:acyltransferase [Streptomyces sp. NPDC093982]|uniref:acyltransferase family protein n=1 Tax=Streptomyces sp. NPDC093982 TaxID=3155077 RepID=UPI003433DFDA
MIATLARPVTEASEVRRIRSIDGLRAVAVLAVMGYHFGVGPSGGFLGVDLFFVISGFVITRLLLREDRIGWPVIRRFYAHRVRRLLPALLCVLVAVQLWVCLTDLPAMRTTVNSQTLATLGFSVNWYTIFADVDYWSVQPDHTPLNHLWSLAVEEQFYLVWPALVVLIVARYRRPRTLVIIACVGAISSYMMAAWHYSPGLPDRAYLGTDARAGSLFLGALSACAAGAFLPRLQKSQAATKYTLPILAALSSCVLLVLWTHSAINSPALYLWQLPLAGLSAAVLIFVLAILDDHHRRNDFHPLSRLVLLIPTARPVVSVGAISYGLYLWHWPLWVYFNHTYPQLHPATLQGAAFVASFVLASLSFLLVESPARRCRIRNLLFSVASVSAVITAFILVSAPVSQDGPTEEGPVVSGAR